MSTPSVAQESWDRRHEGRDLPPPDPWLEFCFLLLPRNGSVLDVACGLGQNALWVTNHDRLATGVDASPVAVERAKEESRRQGSRAEFVCRDVVEDGLPGGPWDGILVFHFLARGLFASLEASLRPGGLLLYKTHLAHASRSTEGRPRNPDFLLRPGELLTSFPSLSPLSYREWARGGDAFAAFAARRP